MAEEKIRRMYVKVWILERIRDLLQNYADGQDYIIDQAEAADISDYLRVALACKADYHRRKKHHIYTRSYVNTRPTN